MSPRKVPVSINVVAWNLSAKSLIICCFTTCGGPKRPAFTHVRACLFSLIPIKRCHIQVSLSKYLACIFQVTCISRLFSLLAGPNVQALGDINFHFTVPQGQTSNYLSYTDLSRILIHHNWRFFVEVWLRGRLVAARGSANVRNVFGFPHLHNLLLPVETLPACGKPAWTLAVIILPRGGQYNPRIVQGAEPVQGEELVAQPAVEALHM